MAPPGGSGRERLDERGDCGRAGTGVAGRAPSGDAGREPSEEAAGGRLDEAGLAGGTGGRFGSTMA
ncbi:MAG TPA: hypothetical protein PKZ67_09390 [Accumulibacter sp.]|nr:hypothetical protein [Accumulibacter sp.]